MENIKTVSGRLKGNVQFSDYKALREFIQFVLAFQQSGKTARGRKAEVTETNITLN